MRRLTLDPRGVSTDLSCRADALSGRGGCDDLSVAPLLAGSLASQLRIEVNDSGPESASTMAARSATVTVAREVRQACSAVRIIRLTPQGCVQLSGGGQRAVLPELGAAGRRRVARDGEHDVRTVASLGIRVSV